MQVELQVTFQGPHSNPAPHVTEGQRGGGGGAKTQEPAV